MEEPAKKVIEKMGRHVACSWNVKSAAPKVEHGPRGVRVEERSMPMEERGEWRLHKTEGAAWQTASRKKRSEGRRREREVCSRRRHAEREDHHRERSGC